MTAGLLLSPVFPPARGGIETMCREIVARGAVDWSVLTLDEDLDEDLAQTVAGVSPEVTVIRVRNVPRGGRRSIARLTARALVGPEASGPDVVLSMHVRCVPAAVLAHRRAGAPWFQYFHAKEVCEYPRQARYALRHAHGCFAVSHFTAGLLADLDPRAAARLEIVSPGVSAPATARPYPTGRPTIVTIARMAHEYKGHDVLVDAVELLLDPIPDLRWVVIGDGERRSWLEAEVVRRGLQHNVVILGAVDDVARDEWLRAAHAFALVSRTPPDGRGGEGFGIVYLEAAAHGVPAVAGTDGGVSDAVADDETGLLVDPRDAEAVAGALQRVLHKPELGKELGAAARRRALAGSWGTRVDEIESVVLGTTRSSPRR